MRKIVLITAALSASLFLFACEPESPTDCEFPSAQYLKALEAPVDWREILETVWVEAAFEKFGELKTSLEGEAMTAKSKHLRICVTENGKTKVELTFRSVAAENLVDLIPEDLEKKLKDRAVDLEKISRDVVSNEFEPGELFRLEEGSKTVRVWLE